MHQREKHLRCPSCNKRMLSVPSLMIHASQMHNLTLSAVPNAVPGRDATDTDVLGMKGIPEEYYRKLEGRRKLTPVSDRLPSNSRLTPAIAQPPVTQPPVTQLPQSQWPWPVHSSDPWSVAQNPMSFYPSSSFPPPPVTGVTPYPPYPNLPAYNPYHHHPSGSSPVSSQIPTSVHHPYVRASYPFGEGSYPRVPVHSHQVHQQHRHERNSYRPHKYNATPHVTHPVTVQRPVPPPHVTGRAAGSIVVGPVASSAPHSTASPGPMRSSDMTSQPVASSGAMNTSQGPSDGPMTSATLSAPTKSETKLVFDVTDMSVEELRAQLPRYQVKKG